MEEEEPAWEAELREAMDERFPFALSKVTHDDVRRFVTPLIKAAEERGRRQALTEAAEKIRGRVESWPGMSEYAAAMYGGVTMAADLIDPDIP